MRAKATPTEITPSFRFPLCCLHPLKFFSKLDFFARYVDSKSLRLISLQQLTIYVLLKFLMRPRRRRVSSSSSSEQPSCTCVENLGSALLTPLKKKGRRFFVCCAARDERKSRGHYCRLYGITKKVQVPNNQPASAHSEGIRKVRLMKNTDNGDSIY